VPAIDLQKKAEQVGIILAKKGISQAPTMRVAVALDISGSMSSIIGSGALQNAFNQLMGVAVKFDDNGELDVFKFDTQCEYVGTSKPETGDYDQYIRNNRIGPRGGTKYGPIVDSAVGFFFEPKKSGGFLGFGSKTEVTDDTPVLMLILTDGEPSDAGAAERAMSDSTKYPIYYHMVGINGERRDFPTIARLADALPNVGEVYLPRLNMSDEEIYTQLICDELIEFIGSHTGIVRRARA
jgi:hypothetical protein